MIIISLFMASHANAQSTGNVDIEVVRPLTIANISDMSFGNIIPGTLRSDITMEQDDGSLFVRNGNAILAGGTVQRAQFVITGEASSQIQISFPNRLNLVRSGGNETIQLNRFRINGSNQVRDITTNIDESGVLPIFVSAQIRVNPQQATGIYRTTYDVTVEYN